MFETAMLFDLMEQLQKKAHKNSRDKGFWTGPDNENVPTKLCLMHSEISEWLEAFRKGNPPCEKTYPREADGELAEIQIMEGGEWRTITSEEEEAADLFIRLLDLCEYSKIDLARVTLSKMGYNSQRPHKHGGKKV